MRAIDQKELAAQLLPVAQAAGRAQMQVYRQDFRVDVKSDDSPVTEADRRSEAIILQALARIAPDIPVVAEEEASAGRIPRIGERFFLVDPLDGTKEFVKRSGEFTVNIGLVDGVVGGAGGVPVFGLVYAPASEELFVTPGENRAVAARLPLEGADAALAQLQTRPLATTEPQADGYRVLASLSHMNDATRNYINRFRLKRLIRAGSSLKFCRLAEGKADFYPRFGPTNEWDTCAGHAILKAAGGDVFTPDGQPLAYGKAAARFANPDFIACALPSLPK